ncbi:hypothetical protein BJX76DRAFT_319516 [Aspergillus varians]
MTSYVLTGTLTPGQELTEHTSRHICTEFTAFLRSKHYVNYEVRIGYRESTSSWRLLVVLLGPVAEMPSLVLLNEVHDQLSMYVSWDTSWFRWVEDLSDCYEVMPDWDEWDTPGVLEHETRLSWDKCLGETF